MKTYTVTAFVLATLLSLPAFAATVVTDPVTGVVYVTTGTVYGVGAAAVNTWNGAVHTTTATAVRATTPAYHGGTTVRHTAGGTTVRHHR